MHLKNPTAIHNCLKFSDLGAKTKPWGFSVPSPPTPPPFELEKIPQSISLPTKYCKMQLSRDLTGPTIQFQPAELAVLSDTTTTDIPL